MIIYIGRIVTWTGALYHAIERSCTPYYVVRWTCLYIEPDWTHTGRIQVLRAAYSVLRMYGVLYTHTYPSYSTRGIRESGAKVRHDSVGGTEQQSPDSSPASLQSAKQSSDSQCLRPCLLMSSNTSVADGIPSTNTSVNSPAESAYNSSSKRRRASTIGSRGVANLTPDQLAKKRANDRDAQRAIRERTKNQIEGLELKIQQLTSQQPYQDLQRVVRQKEAVEAENADIKRRLNAIVNLIQPLLGARSLGDQPLGGSCSTAVELTADLTNRCISHLIRPPRISLP